MSPGNPKHEHADSSQPVVAIFLRWSHVFACVLTLQLNILHNDAISFCLKMFGNDSKTCRSKRGRTNVDGRDTCSLFLGSVVSKYDVDELDAVRKRCKESLVEVKRPDGTVAKSRGERTFYGAFSGGFSAGHYGTVGSKEGWTPSSFCSARQKRSLEPVRTAEDYMDEEDLREHRETHSTIKVRGMYEKPTSSVRDLVSPEVEDLFLRKRLGAKLLDATEDTASASGASEVKAKVRKGCAPNPNAHGLSHLTTRSLLRKTGLRSGGRSHEAKLERLWRCKRDLRGIGFLVDTSICGVSSANTAPSRKLMQEVEKRGQAEKERIKNTDITGQAKPNTTNELITIFHPITHGTQHHGHGKKQDC